MKTAWILAGQPGVRAARGQVRGQGLWDTM